MLVTARVPDEKLWPRRDERAVREELVRRHHPLALKLAGRFRNPHEPIEDLVQIADLALIHAIDRFDPERRIPFGAFATPTIVGEIKRHFRDTGWALHVPRGAAERAQAVHRATDVLTERSGRSPTVAELAAYLEITLEEAVEALDAASARYAVSLDAPVQTGTEDDGSCLVELLGSGEDGFDLVDARLVLADGLRELPFGEQQALNLRLRFGLTQTEIAHRLGCSQMHVSRLLSRAADRLRHRLAGHGDLSPH